MKCILFSVIALFICPLSLAQTVYTWTDNNGVLHLSDTPPVSAANLDSFDIIEQNPTASEPKDSPPPQLPEPDAQELDQPTAKAVKPQPLEIEFESPISEQTIRDNQGRIQIALRSNRKLSIDEKLQLVLNNETYGAPQTKNRWMLTNVDRGTHSLMIKALRNGKLIASTETISVHLHRAKVN